MLLEGISFSKKGNAPVPPTLLSMVLQEIRLMLYHELSPKCTVEAVNEAAGQQACRFSCMRRACSVISSSSFPCLVMVIFIVKGKCVVLQAEPKSIQILAKGRTSFSLLLSPNIIFSFGCGYVL